MKICCRNTTTSTSTQPRATHIQKEKHINWECNKHHYGHRKHLQKSRGRHATWKPAVASLPVSADHNSRGLQSISDGDGRQVQGGSTHTLTEEEDTDDCNDQAEDDEDKEAQSTSMNDDNIDKDTARTETYLRLYFHSHVNQVQ